MGYAKMNRQSGINKKPKVLMIGPGRDVMGGISTVVNSYYELGIDKQVDLKYIATMEDGSALKKLWVAAKAYLQFCFSIKNYDIVHVHMAAQASYTRKSLFIKKAHKVGKKIIIHSHAADFDDFFFKQADDKKRENIKYIFSIADKVITLSEEWAEFFGKNICSEDKIVVMHNAVIMPEYVKTDYRDHNVLFLGRLGERKGTYDILNVIPDILKTVPDAMFYLGGDGDIEQCREITVKNSFADHVKFLGWVRGANKEEYLKRCSIFTLPSYHEGMPMSVLEAMSYGLATVSTNTGGIPQIIDNGVNGIRIDAGNTEALKQNLIQLLTNPDDKEKMGKAGCVTISQKFNAQKTFDNLVNIYLKLFY